MLRFHLNTFLGTLKNSKVEVYRSVATGVLVAYSVSQVLFLLGLVGDNFLSARNIKTFLFVVLFSMYVCQLFPLPFLVCVP